MQRTLGERDKIDDIRWRKSMNIWGYTRTMPKLNQEMNTRTRQRRKKNLPRKISGNKAKKMPKSRGGKTPSIKPTAIGGANHEVVGHIIFGSSMQQHIPRQTHSNQLSKWSAVVTVASSACCFTYWTFAHRFANLLRVPMKPTGKAQAMMRPIVASQDVTYRDFISRAPSSKFLQTMSFGWASIVLLSIFNGY